MLAKRSVNSHPQWRSQAQEDSCPGCTVDGEVSQATLVPWASPSRTTSLGTKWHSSSRSGFCSLALIFWLRVSSGL